MRSEQQMLDTILNLAKSNPLVRAVYMNGSRVNPGVTADRYQDFDIVFVVTETAPLIADERWLAPLGEPAIVQRPDAPAFGWGKDANPARRYAWLMLFADTNRIDLTIVAKEAAQQHYLSDSLTRLLLDKDGFLPALPPPTDSDYWVQKPTAAQYAGSQNEFWWCLGNVAKGLARNQLPYALRMYWETSHRELERMLDWYIGSEHRFEIATGMWGKYHQNLLPAPLYEALLSTYPGSTAKSIWRAVFTACDLFGEAGRAVGRRLGYSYNESDEHNVRRYLQQVKQESTEEK